MRIPTTVAAMDVDGGVRDAAERVHRLGRRELLGAGGVAAAAVLLLRSGGPLAAGAAPSKQGDVAIWNFALTLEYLEQSFYDAADASHTLTGETAVFASVARQHEVDHVAFLRKALGSSAVARPRFDFGSATTDQAAFTAAAIAIEDLGVAAYNGQGPNLTPAGRGLAAMIVSVEARHAAWIRGIAGRPPASVAFDEAMTRSQVLAAVNQTGFIRS